MGTLPVIVGLDYSDRAVQVCVLDQEGQVVGNRACANDWQEIVKFAQSRGQVVRSAIESCSGAAALADELVARAGWHVDLAHPGYVARMKQSPDKTDYQDARLIADLERVGYLPRVWLAPEPIRDLRRLVRYRQQLVDQRKAVKLRIRALLREQRCRPPAEANAWTRAWLAWAEQAAAVSEHSRWIMARHVEELQRVGKDIKEAEKRLAEATANDPVVGTLVLGLLAVSGFGATYALVTWRDRTPPSPTDAPAGMVWIPGGEFTMGTDSEIGWADEKPAHRVRVDPFWM